MALPITVPYTFGNATTAIPLSNLDSDYATVYQAVNGIGNGSVARANVAITGGTISGNTTASNVTVSSGTFTNVTLSNVTISSVSTPITAAEGGTGSSSAFTANGVVYASSTSALATGSALTFDGAILGVNGVSVGRGAGAVSTNTAVGASAGATNSNGAYNTNIGNTAGYSNSTGQFNVTLGFSTGYFNTGSNNTYLGTQAGPNTTASSSGSNNTAVGYQAGGGLTTGGGNTFLGNQTGYYGGNNLTTGLYNTYIGNSVYPSSSSASYELVIGSTGSTGGKGSNTGYIVTFNGSTTGNIYQGSNSTLWSVTSDQRLKKNIINNNVGLEKIAQIQVRNFEYRLSDEITDLPKDQAIIKDGIQLGVIAQEIQTILPECVKTESTGVMTVNSDPLIWYLINSVKELSAELNALKTKVGI